MTTKATLRTLQDIKDVTPETARRILQVWTKATREQICSEFPKCEEYVRMCFHPRGTRALRRIAIDSLLGTYGVEFLGESHRTGENVYYCNAGDTYDTTVIFNGPSMRVGCWGDLIEHHAIVVPSR